MPQLTALLRLSEALSVTQSLAAIVDELPDLTRSSTGAHFAAIALTSPNGQRLQHLNLSGLDAALIERWSDVAISDTAPHTDVARQGRPQYFTDLRQAIEAYPQLATDLRTSGLHARATLPLVAAGDAIGTVTLGWTTSRNFSQRDRDFLAVLAAFIAQAVARIRLTEQRRADAEILQRSLLTRLPQPDHLQLAARYLPAAVGDQVGGDWYDAIVDEAGLVTLVIGDVTGHDMQAAAVMGQIRGALRAFAVDRTDAPAALLHRLDTSLTALDIHRLATAVVANIHIDPAPDSGCYKLDWSNAGHPPPVILHSDGRIEALDPDADILLGFDAASPRTTHASELCPGSTLLLYTDGLIEKRGRGVDEGLLELLAALQRHAHLKLDDLLDAVMQDMVRGSSEDDTAVLAVRLHDDTTDSVPTRRTRR